VTVRCPSDLALEGYLLEPERSSVTAHVDGCPQCRARVARMQAEGEEFNQFVFPATVDAIQDAASPTWRTRWLRFVTPVAALATVGAAALLMVRTGPIAPPGDYVGTKGPSRVGTAGLKVFVGAEDGARAVEDGGVVPAGAALRFSVKPDDGKCFLWIASVDTKGQISRLYPPPGVPVRNFGPGAVPGGAILDGQPGLERLFAVCSDEDDTKWEDVRQAVSPAAGGEGALRRTRELGKPLADECQSSLLLDKR
jgi:hypothetical protein